MSEAIVSAIDYVQGCLTIARTEFTRDNPKAAIVELKKAAARLEEAITEEKESGL